VFTQTDEDLRRIALENAIKLASIVVPVRNSETTTYYIHADDVVGAAEEFFKFIKGEPK
jgi:hypothetical protein